MTFSIKARKLLMIPEPIESESEVMYHTQTTFKSI